MVKAYPYSVVQIWPRDKQLSSKKKAFNLNVRE